MENNYSVIFDGRKVPEPAVFGVKQRLKDLFKADQARIDALFNGKPTAIKRQLTREVAAKYQRMLKNAGVEVSVVQVGTSQSNTGDKAQSLQTKSSFTLAPVGSDLSPAAQAKQTVSPMLERIETLVLTPQTGNLIKPEEVEQKPESFIDDASIDWALSEQGEELLKESEKSNSKRVEIDTSMLAFDNSEAPLSAPVKNSVPVIRTEHIQLQPVEKTDK